jgi:hypothetical protein
MQHSQLGHADGSRAHRQLVRDVPGRLVLDGGAPERLPGPFLELAADEVEAAVKSSAPLSSLARTIREVQARAIAGSAPPRRRRLWPSSLRDESTIASDLAKPRTWLATDPRLRGEESWLSEAGAGPARLDSWRSSSPSGPSLAWCHEESLGTGHFYCVKTGHFYCRTTRSVV